MIVSKAEMVAVVMLVSLYAVLLGSGTVTVALVQRLPSSSALKTVSSVCSHTK